MNALMRKEFRLLLPAWIVALVLVVLQFVFLGGFQRSAFTVPAFCLAALLLGLSSFGRELSSGCFSLLLAQPTPRLRVWRTKVALLITGACSVFFLWVLFCFARSADVSANDFWQELLGGGLLGFAFVVGGLWTTLLFRQVAAAFWISLLTPAALGIGVAQVAGWLAPGIGGNAASAWRSPENIAAVAAVAVTILYSIAGYWFARRLFLRAQDTSWTGGEITLPRVRGLARLKSGWNARRGARPRVALLVKELQLHQAQLVVAGALVLLHLAVIALRKFGGEFTKQQVAEFILDGFWALWLVMPLLVGCAAVAEERKLGTLEGQLCLPVNRRWQFVTKAGVVLLLSLVLGVAMPLLLEGHRVLPDAHFSPELAKSYFLASTPASATSNLLLVFLALASQWLPLLILCVTAVTVGTLSFYISTLMRNPLQALGPAVLSIVVAVTVLVSASQPEYFFNYPLWRGWLIYLVGVPVLTLTVAGLAYWNFKRVLVGWPVWRRNILVFLASLAFVIVATSAVYHRAWEFLTPLEPPHGAPRLSLAQGVTLRNDGGNVVMQLADGRIWTDRFLLLAPHLQMLTGDWKVFEASNGGIFFEGTNWASVTVCHPDMVGVRKDGSLWVSAESKLRRLDWAQRNLTNACPTQLERLGNDNDWKSVAGTSYQVFLLKTDGSLWRLGTNRFDGRKRWPGLRAFKPERLGIESDWAELEASGYEIIFRQVDGRAWVRGYSGSHLEWKNFGKDLSIDRAPALDKHRWRSPVMVYGLGIGGVQVGIRDGVFGVCGDYRLPKGKTSGQLEWKDANVRVGKETNWLAVAANGQTVVTLKADGSLWKWEFLGDPIIAPWLARATKLGTHSDWVGVSQDMGGIISLASDGSLWLWRFEPRRVYSPDSPQPLLAFTRKPQRIGSVFGDAK